MSLGGVLSAGSKLIGGLAAKKGSDKAGQIAAAATEQARADLAPYREGGELGLNAVTSALGLSEGAGGNPFNLQPQQLMGQNLLQSNVNPYSVENLSEGFQESPGFQFQLQHGLDAMESRGAAKGGLLSGNNTAAVNEYAQGVANQDYWNFIGNQRTGLNLDVAQRQQQFGNLFNLSEQGRQAATSSGQFSLQGAGIQAGAAQAGGQALGGAIAGAGDTLGAAVQARSGLGGGGGATSQPSFLAGGSGAFGGSSVASLPSFSIGAPF